MSKTADKKTIKDVEEKSIDNATILQAIQELTLAFFELKAKHETDSINLKSEIKSLKMLIQQYAQARR